MGEGAGANGCDTDRAEGRMTSNSSTHQNLLAVPIRFGPEFLSCPVVESKARNKSSCEAVVKTREPPASLQQAPYRYLMHHGCGAFPLLPRQRYEI